MLSLVEHEKSFITLGPGVKVMYISQRSLKPDCGSMLYSNQSIQQNNKKKFAHRLICVLVFASSKSGFLMKYHMSHCIRKSTISVCENKAADQLRRN